MNKHTTLRFGFWTGLLTMIASTLLFGAMTTASVAAAVGDWDGKIDTGSGILRVVVHISQTADGKLTGSLDSPDQDTAGIVISSVTYTEPDLHFAIERLESSYDGKMNRDNSEIAGDWKQSGITLPLVFKRHSK